MLRALYSPKTASSIRITVWKEQGINVLIDEGIIGILFGWRTRLKLSCRRFWQLSFKTREQTELWMLENQSARRNCLTWTTWFARLQADAADRQYAHGAC